MAKINSVETHEIQQIAERLDVTNRYLSDLVSAGVLVNDLEFVVETAIALISNPTGKELIGFRIVALVWLACEQDEDLFEEIVDLAIDIEKGSAHKRLSEAAGKRLGTVLPMEDDSASIDKFGDESSPDFARETEEQSAVED